jgi:diacylglycerol kinase family enzyme
VTAPAGTINATILVNAGGGSAGDDGAARVAEALRKAGIAGEVEEVEGGRLAERAAQAVQAGARLVVAAGGDGTLSAVAGAVAGSEAVLGILPLGTLNHLARDLGISFDLDEAAATLAAGHEERIDVARLGDRRFVNNSAIGLYPLMVADREAQQARLGRSKRLAMLVAGLRTVARFHHHRLCLRVNESETETVDTALLFVGNNDYRLDAGGAGQRASISDGRLCVIAMRRMGRMAFFAALVRALAGRSRDSDMIRLDDVRTLTVTSRRSHLRVAIDGETCHLSPPLDYAIEAGALRVIVPSPTADAKSA